MDQPPFAYVITEQTVWGSEVLSVARTLAGAIASLDVRARMDNTGLGPQMIVTAYFDDGRSVVVPRPAYAQQVHEPEAEVRAWIRKRAARIVEERQRLTDAERARGAGTLSEISGIGRCNPNDSEDKQVADYQRTAPWTWRADVDEGWWRTHEYATP